jgi:hypothetical protein
MNLIVQVWDWIVNYWWVALIVLVAMIIAMYQTTR